MYLATILALTLLWLLFWVRFRDPFHPAIVLLPMFAFLYGYMPWELRSSDPRTFWDFSGGYEVYWYQFVTLALIAALLLGVGWSSRGQTRKSMRWRVLSVSKPRRVMFIAAVLGAAGLSTWLYTIYSVGGFLVAYGSAYGGGWSSSGYIREMRDLGLIGALFVFMARTGKGMRIQDWALIVICMAPTLIHALLGARRGPLFLVVIVLFGGYIFFMRKKVPMVVIVGAGMVIGATMLLLVANRDAIYLGGEIFSGSFRDPKEFLIQWNANEYLIGGAVVRHAEQYGAFYGRRELAWLIARLMPSFVWPSVWDDLPALLDLSVDLRVNGGVSQDKLTTLANWTPSVGSAEGFTGSLVLEFGWVAPFISFAIGAFYGRFWVLAKTRLSARVLYLLMIAMSVYLVMQALDPWLYRLLLYGAPAYLVALRIHARPVDADFTAEGR